ncbi:MAG: hypothetical protein H0V17_20005 [Deltaproteobacteria bacterium]|nr:hypothetical protein [Deltaproteobacteria bacterium]
MKQALKRVSLAVVRVQLFAALAPTTLIAAGCTTNDEDEFENFAEATLEGDDIGEEVKTGAKAQYDTPKNREGSHICFTFEAGQWKKLTQDDVKLVVAGGHDPLQRCSYNVNHPSGVAGWRNLQQKASLDTMDVEDFYPVCSQYTEYWQAPFCEQGAGIGWAANGSTPPPAEADIATFNSDPTRTSSSTTGFRAGPGCNHRQFPNAFGSSQTVTADDSCIDLNGPFFTAFAPGNGRTCQTCHKITDGWTMATSTVNFLFDETNPKGTNPIFRLNDGANSPAACQVSGCDTEAEMRTAYSQVLKNGNIRVGNSLPAVGISPQGQPSNRDFDLIDTNTGNPVEASPTYNDKYGWYNHPSNTSHELSLFRRPLPTANVKYLSGIMWDVRESVAAHAGYNPNGNDPQPAVDQNDPPTTLLNQMWQNGNMDWKRLATNIRGLWNQSSAATVGHAQGPNLTPQQRLGIVKLELEKFTAQSVFQGVGPLHDPNSNVFGGPQTLRTPNYWMFPAPAGQTSYYAGIFDPLGYDPVPTWLGSPVGPNAINPLLPAVFTNYPNTWANGNAQRQSIKLGQDLFNNVNNQFTFVLQDVGGINGPNDAAPLFGVNIPGACTTCHDSPNLGHHSFPQQLGRGGPFQYGNDLCNLPTVDCKGGLDIGLVSAPSVATRPNVMNTADFPTYTLRKRTWDGAAWVNCPNCTTVQVTDPGRALLTGRFEDVGKFKGPILRALAPRAPYMHNGVLQTLEEVISFYVGGCFLPSGRLAQRLDDTANCGASAIPAGSTWKARFLVSNGAFAIGGQPPQVITPSRAQVRALVNFLASL